MTYEVEIIPMKNDFMIVLWAVDTSGCKSIVDAQDNITAKQYSKAIEFFNDNAHILNLR